MADFTDKFGDHHHRRRDQRDGRHPSLLWELLGGLKSGALETTVSNAEITHGDVVVANFTIGAAGRTFHDTAAVRDDKILVLTTVNYPAP